MKKLLLVLVTTMVFGSALADIKSQTKINFKNKIEASLVQDFVLKKAVVNHGLLNSKRGIVIRPPTCKPIIGNCVSCNGVTYCIEN